jgi:hypothetical protein
VYSLIKNSTWKEVLANELLPMFAAGVLAELFFKWRSFTLEAIGFLTVWFVFGWVAASVRGAMFSRSS